MTDTIAICVCTCMRPKMLAACLASLSQQRLPEDVSAYIVVIDNDPEGSAADAVAAHSNASPLLTFYISEPIRGIAKARNAALDAVSAIGADWVAFVDDDEIAAPDWVAGLMASEYRDTPVLAGPTVPIYPDDTPFWCLRTEKKLKPGEEGRQLLTATTGNVRFSSDLLRAGFRFNESLRLMGGEDQEFFSSAHKAGFTIRKSLKPIVYELAHPERLTYRRQVARAYWCAASDIRRDAILKGWWRTVRRKTHTVPFGIAFGTLEVIASPLFLPFGIDSFRRRALAGGKKMAKGIGRAAAMVGVIPQPYRVIDGN